jgi:hypothetical protein
MVKGHSGGALKQPLLPLLLASNLFDADLLSLWANLREKDLGFSGLRVYDQSKRVGV